MRTNRVAKALKRPLARFARAQRGAVGLLFALAAIPAFALAGGVVDYISIQNEKAKLQNAADAAVLAAMKLETPTDDEIREAVINYLSSNYRTSPQVTIDFQDVEVDVERNGDTPVRVTVRIPARVQTGFWSLVGINQANLRVEAEASQGTGGIEVVMVLDNTGSMRGDKIKELQAAAKDLVDELEKLANNAQINVVKVGLVPYTNYVNVGTGMAGASWLDMSACCGNFDWEGLVGSRPVPEDITDEGYAFSGVPAVARVYQYYDAYTDSTSLEVMSSIPQPITPLQDLTDPGAVSTLKNNIDDMFASGWTYIPAGLVWGWRVLSPQAPYTEGMDFDEAREQNVRKVVILMTDGSNTCHNLSSPVGRYENIKECGYRQDIHDDANERMRQLCEAMHDEGILIASVAYEVTDNSDAADTIRELMEECGNYGYYTPAQGELRDVFREIARRLTKLHLSR